MADSYAHLHVHTEYSMLDGAAKIGALFSEVERLGMSAVIVPTAIARIDLHAAGNDREWDIGCGGEMSLRHCPDTSGSRAGQCLAIRPDGAVPFLAVLL